MPRTSPFLPAALMPSLAPALPPRPASVADVPAGPKIGSPAPDFTFPAVADGKSVALKELLGKGKAVAVRFVGMQSEASLTAAIRRTMDR